MQQEDKNDLYKDGDPDQTRAYFATYGLADSEEKERMQLLTGKDAFHVVIARLRGLHGLHPYRTVDTSSAEVVRVPAIKKVWLRADLNLSYYLSARTNSNLEPTKALEVRGLRPDGRSQTLGTLVQDYDGDRLQWTLLDAATETALTSFPRALFFKESQHVRIYLEPGKKSNKYKYQVLWEDVDNNKWYLVGDPIEIVQHMEEHLKWKRGTAEEHSWRVDEPDTQHDDRVVMVCVDEDNIIQDVSVDFIQFLQTQDARRFTKSPFEPRN
jgi:hypothetical protein